MSRYQKAKQTARIIVKNASELYPNGIPEGIRQFYETLGKRYGLIKEFRAKKII